MDEARQLWDRAAATFDEEPDHGLRDPGVRAAWTKLLSSCLPTAPAAILDAGCGTGSLSVVLTGLGYDVTGIDLSPAMIALARAKAAAGGHTIAFQVMDADRPRLAPGQFDALVCRHLLWALSDTARVLERWAGLLKTPGRLLIIEGRWSTGAGLPAAQIVEALPRGVTPVAVRDLTLEPDLWGRPVADERYAIIADKIYNLETPL